MKKNIIIFLFLHCIFSIQANAACSMVAGKTLSDGANNDICINPLGSTLTFDPYYGAPLSIDFDYVTLNNLGAANGTGTALAIWGGHSTLNNSGTIISDMSFTVAITGGSASNATLNNTGSIIATGSNSAVWADNSAINLSLVNDGEIRSQNHDAIVNWGSYNLITNTGTIQSLQGYGIRNGGIITTLNNSQGITNSAGALTYSGALPTNYNIIITDATHYGQLSAISANGSTNFGIYNTSTITSKLYTGVLQGLTTSNVGATRSGTYNGLNWTLALQNGSSSVWDLIFTGGSTVDTQSSIHSLASKLRGAFSGQTVATNFANMNTYDCSLFDAKGLCVSVGGQQTYVDSPSANMTSAVVVAGYKVSPTLRIGGFLNQNVNSNTGSNVDISNNSPLMGLFAVWNQNENHLGYQVKIANAYQDMGVRTTRDVIGTSEAGKGKTDLNTQSYVGELSYAFLANEDKTLVRPYAAVRYTRIKQDGYTEDATVSAPLTYAALSDRSTAALVGVKLNHKLADKVNLTASFGVEQDLNHDVDNLTASGVSGLTSENFNNNINRTRPVASVGAYYMPVKNQRIAADVYYQELPFQSTASTTAYVNYMIGF